MFVDLSLFIDFVVIGFLFRVNLCCLGGSLGLCVVDFMGLCGLAGVRWVL